MQPVASFAKTSVCEFHSQIMQRIFRLCRSCKHSNMQWGAGSVISPAPQLVELQLELRNRHELKMSLHIHRTKLHKQMLQEEKTLIQAQWLVVVGCTACTCNKQTVLQQYVHCHQRHPDSAPLSEKWNLSKGNLVLRKDNLTRFGTGSTCAFTAEDQLTVS